MSLSMTKTFQMNHKLVLPNFLLVAFIIIWSGCNNDYYPKPRGHFRIDLPEKNYIRFDTTFPYSFNYPVYSTISSNPLSEENKYWLNVEFNRFKGKIHLSYKPIKNNLNDYIEDTRTLAMKHIPKASGIKTNTYLKPGQNVYGLTYIIEGVGAASPFQFYLTDSTKHFVRGALYFNTVPNNDSLAPVIDFLKEDIKVMIESFEWRDLN